MAQLPIKYISRYNLLKSWFESRLNKKDNISDKGYVGWSPQNIRGIISYISDSIDTSGVILLRHLNLDGSPKVINLSYTELLRDYKKNNDELAKKYDLRVDEERPGVTVKKEDKDGKQIPPPLSSVFNISSLRFEVTREPRNLVQSVDDLVTNASDEMSIAVGDKYLRAYISGREYKGLEEFVLLYDNSVVNKNWVDADKEYIVRLQTMCAGIRGIVSDYNSKNPNDKRAASLLVWNRLYGAGYFNLACDTQQQVTYKLQNSDKYGKRFDMLLNMCKESTADHVSYKHFCELLDDKNIPLRFDKNSPEPIPVVFGGKGKESIKPLFLDSWYKYVPGTLTPKSYMQDSTNDGVLYNRFKAIEEHYENKNKANVAIQAIEQIRRQLSSDIVSGMRNMEYPVRFWPAWLEMLAMTYFNIQMLAGNMCQLELLRGYSAESAYTDIKETKLMRVMLEIVQGNSSTLGRTEQIYKQTVALSKNKNGEVVRSIASVHENLSTDLYNLAVSEKLLPNDYKPSLQRAITFIYSTCVGANEKVKLVTGAGVEDLQPMFEEYLTAIYFILDKNKMRDIKYKYTAFEDNIDVANESRQLTYNMFKIQSMDSMNGFAAIKPIATVISELNPDNKANMARVQDLFEHSYGCIGDTADRAGLLSNIYVGTCTNKVGFDADVLLDVYKKQYYNDNKYNELQNIVGSPWSLIKNEVDANNVKADIHYLGAFVESRILRQYAIGMIEWLNYMDIMYNEEGTMRLDLLTPDMYENIVRQVTEKGFPVILLCKRTIFGELREIYTAENWEKSEPQISDEIDRIWNKVVRLFPQGYFRSRLVKVDKLTEYKVEAQGDIAGGLNCKDIKALLYTNGFLLSSLVTHGLRASNVRSSVYKKL